MGESTEGRVCAGGCGKALRRSCRSGYCEKCWRASPEGKLYFKRYHAEHYILKRTTSCRDCSKSLNSSSRPDVCALCWRKTPEGKRAYTDNHNRWDRQRMANPESKTELMVKYANARAAKNGLPYGVKLSDLMPLPTICPVLGLALTYKRDARSNASASLDRIIPSLGYVAGNVRIISWRANCLKRDGTPDELYAVAMDAMRIAKRIV